MKTFQSTDINPALNTKWFIEKDGKIYRFYVKGIVSTGILDQFRIISYELQYLHKQDTQIVPADKLLELIRTRGIRPDWDDDGSMTRKEEEN